MYINNQENLCEGKFIDKNIDKVIFGPDVKYIPENCFNGCNNLKEIIFEGNIDSIEAAAFMECKNLKTISANNVNIIKDFAFYNCNNIIDFNIKEDIANNIIYGINNDILSTYFLLPEIGTPLNDISWYKINMISKQGKAKNYFKIGDEKELIINKYNYADYEWTTKTENMKTHPETTYTVQILGFNHDILSENTNKKVGITFGLKECMVTTHVINFNNTNIGGWEKSNVKTYLQNDVYNALPFDLQQIIKTVNKISDIGYKDKKTLNITKDKLFLFSSEEVGLKPSYYVDGQGVQYGYFTDNTSRIKYFDNYATWWSLRSTYTDSKNSFYNIYITGNDCYAYHADGSYRIVFGFCI